MAVTSLRTEGHNGDLRSSFVKSLRQLFEYRKYLEAQQFVLVAEIIDNTSKLERLLVRIVSC